MSVLLVWAVVDKKTPATIAQQQIPRCAEARYCPSALWTWRTEQEFCGLDTRVSLTTCWYGSLKLHAGASPVAASICCLSVWIVIQGKQNQLPFCKLRHI